VSIQDAITPDVEKRLHQIFDFYCKHDTSTVLKESATFDEIVHKMKVLVLSKWMLFCREFGLLT